MVVGGGQLGGELLDGVPPGGEPVDGEELGGAKVGCGLSMCGRGGEFGQVPGLNESTRENREEIVLLASSGA